MGIRVLDILHSWDVHCDDLIIAINDLIFKCLLISLLLLVYYNH